MKKLLSCLVSLSILLSLSVIAYAVQKTFTATESQVKLLVNGMVFSPKDAEEKALPLVEINGVLYVPAKEYSASLGKDFNVDAEKNTVTVTEKKPAATGTAASASRSADETMGQKNALAKAEAYLRFTAFSYQDLVEQLEYSKFSYEDAVYAADRCGADWNEQAVKKAKSYLNLTAFSREELIEQLEYSGFTYEQALYGVTANGY